MVNRESSPVRFFTKEEKNKIVSAIREAEKKTSGEICVYLERKEKGDTLNRAKEIFRKLGMTKTARRNGVLVYFSLVDHHFAIVGDRGIHDKVGEDFWRDAVSVMERSFGRKDFVGGLGSGIQRIGEKLKIYFPREANDINELPDVK